MANFTLTAVAPTVVYGAGIEPFVSWDYDIIAAAFPAIAANDVVFSPVIDLKAVMAQCNRAVIIKDSGSANADVVVLQGSNDQLTWHDLPQYNSNAGVRLNTAATYVTSAGLPIFRYVRASIQLITAVPASLRLCIGLMRY